MISTKHTPAAITIITLLLFIAILFSCNNVEKEVPYYNIDADKMADSVTITRDSFGIAHVKGPTDESVLFGVAYARAEDHFELIEKAVIGSIGRLAETDGESGVAFDYILRAFKVEELSKKEYAAFPNKIKLLCDAYAAGLNYFLKTNTRVKPRLIDRFEPWHFLAVERYMWSVLGFSQTGLREDEVAEYIRNKREPRAGSNMWAISPKKSKNEKTYLVINPHIPADQPYEIHLKSDEGMNFYGMMAYGTNMLPVVGHSEYMGWSLTVNYPDVGDAFEVTFDHPSDSLKYKFGNGYKTAESWVDSIKVKTDSGMVIRKYSFLRTLHGPVFKRDGKKYLCYNSAGIEKGGSVPQFYGMVRSRNLKDFKSALSRTSLAFHNVMYADRDGQIFYVYNGAIPKRNQQFDWTKPVDGSDRASRWLGYHNFDDLPQLQNPASGFLQNCNSNPFYTTKGKNPDPDDFPNYMTYHQEHSERAKRSLQILDTLRDISVHQLERAIMDTYVPTAERDLPELFAQYDSIMKSDKQSVQKLSEPIEVLKAWDKYSGTSSEAASLYFIYMFMKDRLNVSANAKVAALEAAVKALEKDKGTWRVAWGDIMRHQRAKDNSQYGVSDSAKSYPLPGANGATGAMFCIWDSPLRDSVTRRSIGGHSYVAVVEFSKDGVQAKSVLTYGVSRDPSSPHYNDQAEMYAKGEFKKVLFSDGEIEANIEERYHPGARKKYGM